jgi:hypothetical protein
VTEETVLPTRRFLSIPEAILFIDTHYTPMDRQKFLSAVAVRQLQGR